MDLVNGDGREVGRMAQAARVGDQAHLPATRNQRLGGSPGREHVSTGSPGRNQAATRCHAA